MMPEGLDRFASTALPDLDPIDLSALARRARRRRHSRRGAVVGGVALIVLALVAAVVVPRHQDESQRVVTSPDTGFVLEGEPVGAWSEGAPPPFPPRTQAFTTALEDGRILIWGGVDADPSIDHPAFATDGAIYDPADDTWESVSPMPLPPGVSIPGPSGSAYYSMQVADNRLAVVARTAGDVLVAAAYDIDGETWTMAPPQSDLDGGVDAVGWDGTTLALVRTSPGFADAQFSVPGPFTRRWSPGEASWSPGTPPPLTPRTPLGSSSADGRLAVFGGTSTPYPPPVGGGNGADPGIVRDGAIYDIAADTWSPIPPPPVDTGIGEGIVTWRGEGLLVGGGSDSFSETATTFSTPAVFDPAEGTWRDLPPAPPVTEDFGEGPRQVTAGPTRPYWDIGGFSQAGQRFAVAASHTGSVGDHPWFLIDDSWEQSPLFYVVGTPELTIASGESAGGTGVVPPGSDYADVAVREGPGRWRPGVSAPVDEPWVAAFVTADVRLVVITGGGYESASGDGPHQTWLFDPDG